jgi:hypothetical protein
MLGWRTVLAGWATLLVAMIALRATSTGLPALGVMAVVVAGFALVAVTMRLLLRGSDGSIARSEIDALTLAGIAGGAIYIGSEYGLHDGGQIDTSGPADIGMDFGGGDFGSGI